MAEVTYPPIEDAHLPVGAPDYSFITDRLAVGDVNSRAVPGFCAVVSLLATSPWDELHGAPSVPADVPVLHVDINDGEGPGSGFGDGRDLATHLDRVASFYLSSIDVGCVLIHCGAGKSRSVAVACAMLCRFAGMSWVEAEAFVKARRPGACPAPAFRDAVERWLRLPELTAGGPRR